MRCKFCGRKEGTGQFDLANSCMNTRDMEDFAELGDDTCFYQLAKLGGGEKGLNYIIANREKMKAAV